VSYNSLDISGNTIASVFSSLDASTLIFCNFSGLLHEGPCLVLQLLHSGRFLLADRLWMIAGCFDPRDVRNTKITV
jgi:hypothetical protein